MKLIGILMQFGVGSAQGSMVFTECLRAVSAGGWVFVGALFTLALAAGFTRRKWMPALMRMLVRPRGVHPEWIVIPDYGFQLALFGAFLLFPITSVFCALPGAWIYFLIAGWGAAGVVVVCWLWMVPSGALLMSERGYRLAPLGGFRKYRELASLPAPKVSSAWLVGAQRYIVSCLDRRGRRHEFCYFALGSFSGPDRPRLRRYSRGNADPFV